MPKKLKNSAKSTTPSIGDNSTNTAATTSLAKTPDSSAQIKTEIDANSKTTSSKTAAGAVAPKQEMIVLFRIPSPTKIKYSKKPTLKSKKIDEIDPTDFAIDKASMKAWMDGIVASPEMAIKFKSAALKKRYQLICGKAPVSTLHSLKERFTKVPNYMVLFESNPRVGLGVSLDLNTKLPAYTVVDVFCGELVPSVNSFSKKKRMYSAVWTTEAAFRDELSANITSISIDPESIGSTARFFQDAPLAIELDAITNISADIKKRIATATLAMNTGVYDGVPFSYLFTLRDMAPGEPLTWSYGDGTANWFEKHNLRRYVTDHAGEVVGYIEKNKIIFDYPERFMEDVNAAINIFIKVYANPNIVENRPIKAQLDRIQAEFNQKMNDEKTAIETRFVILQSLLANKELQPLYDSKLKSLKEKFERYIEEYEAGRVVEGLVVPRPTVTAATKTATAASL